ncbi:hypothetical protein KKG29_01550 [Patescibacteria group bacterium]|nr:hypothetical protein [Patescibacteria group bacterium]MBU3999848.1 hypothetical protein [Patescibacteria group bacterium]MBU4056988.1 hypothetical protein [Patescibacteria group bacterium]MBU4369094.1 hypothetical protein [Patescibacteria group bacterium]
MDSELEILKRIWENNGKSNIRLISSQVGFGIDYTRYVSNCLRGKGQVKPVADGKNWYGITSCGKKRLRSRGIVKLKVKSEKLKVKAKETEKAIYHFPKKLKVKSLGGAFKKTGTAKMLKGNLLKAKDRKLNLGRSIAKAALLLKNQLKD